MVHLVFVHKLIKETSMKLNGTLVIALSTALMAIGMSGCYLRPNLGPPGTIYEQRARAVLNDPFPSTDLGPTIVGGRPRGFDVPLAEPTNIQASPYSEINKTNRGPFQRLFGPRPPVGSNF